MNPDISGYWHGVLDTGSAKVKLVFRLDPETQGGVAVLRTTVQGDVSRPLRRQGERIAFDATGFDIALDFALDSSGVRLEGVCRHADADYPVAFERGLPPPPVRAPRPQTPAPPFPYETRTVEFEAADASRLAGTLTLPAGQPPHACVVLSSWFGQCDRDQTTAGHRPFAIWADALTRRGLATLRYDKRGVGESSGAFDQTTTADSAADLARAVAFLRNLPEIDPARIGLMGHSEGGHISADVAANDHAVAFCVMLTPSGVTEEVMFETELFRAAIAVGATPIRPERRIRLAHALAEAERAATAEEAVALTRAVLEDIARERGFPPEHIEWRAAFAASPWRRHWRRYDHTAGLRSLTCPVLIVFAGQDLQTPPAYHAPSVRAALARQPRAAIVELPGLNHLLQTAKTGAHSEYVDIEETLAPEAIRTVCDWVCRTA